MILESLIICVCFGLNVRDNVYFNLKGKFRYIGILICCYFILLIVY